MKLSKALYPTSRSEYDSLGKGICFFFGNTLHNTIQNFYGSSNTSQSSLMRLT